MLHEILLSLSGQPSPLFSPPQSKDTLAQDGLSILSPPERALLGSVTHLGQLHARLRSHTSQISSSHGSVICRSVSTTIATVHLGAFQKKILDVEKAILAEDSGYVGGYGIVPLSTVVGEFAPWTRRMEWLWEIVRFILPEKLTAGHSYGCSGAGLIDYLRAETLTGYLDIKEMAVQLATAAETAWMKQLSMWLLYGNLPMYGKEDFFIYEEESEDDDNQFSMKPDLRPEFVSVQTAASILFIGKSLNHIRAKRRTSGGISTAPVRLYQEHIEQLAGLTSPISASKLSTAVDWIRLSLSQSTLSKLLPLPKILEMLELLHNFLLLGRGEFAVALVAHADSRMEESRQRGARGKAPGALEKYLVKEGDVMTALAQTWAELVSLQKEEDPTDEELELARELLRLSISERKSGRVATPSQGLGVVPEISTVSFEDLLFPTPTNLTVHVRAPLDLFLSSSDIAIYSKIHSYLLGIRRAQIRLGDLWKRTSLRRNHPSPWGPPRSNSAFGQNKLEASRERDNARIRHMRPVWATASACLFVLSEIGTFFQGEVVHESWQHLREWIQGSPESTSVHGSRPGTASSSKPPRNSRAASPDRMSSRPSSQSGPTMVRHDPEALTVAHRRHLSSLVKALFLTEVQFTSALRALLTGVDRFVALTIRLEAIQRNMDLETDEGVVDALIDYVQEEQEVWQELRATSDNVKRNMKDLVASLREIDDSRSGGESVGIVTTGLGTGPSTGPGFRHYVPRQPAGVDRLLMKLDFGSLRGAGITGLADLVM
ncbi:hypothetical protein PENDEC_c004G02465 [Penicillium decumbens]|uniref:Spindle pole body component n=1 Tax=Penicillium decumbens TaxID=69771 RepID=A0A1V6PJ01_PENDC|nr:hypothetical protein PENDEC_c004G02465 [Penicillium decumbens]